MRITQDIDLDSGELLKERKERLYFALIPFGSSAIFSKKFHKGIPPFKTYNYHGMLSVLSMRLERCSNRLIKDGVRVVKPMSKEDIIAYLKVSPKTYARFFKECISTGVMCVDNGEHFINPAYYLNGGKITYKLYKLFKDNEAMRRYITKDVKDILDKFIEECHQSDLSDLVDNNELITASDIILLKSGGNNE